MSIEPKRRVVLELFQVQAAPDMDLQSALKFPAEKEILEQDIVPELVTRLDWGGRLVDRTHESRKIALRIVDSARNIAEGIEIAKVTDDQCDSTWEQGGTSLLAKLFGTSDPKLVLSSFNTIAAKCQQILKEQDTLVQVPAPCKLFGDVHGQVQADPPSSRRALTRAPAQFRDLLLLLRMFGFPTHRGGDVETVSYVFNGDWVDRGTHQVPSAAAREEPAAPPDASDACRCGKR